ncbi:MAG: formylglycine-generating enzyme family protein [Opitutales bacterium]
MSATLPGMLRRVFLCFALLGPMLPRPAQAAARPDGPVCGRNFTVSNPAIAMIWVRPGTLMMSGTLSQGDDTVVTLTKGYWLGRTEVTQEQWQAIMDFYPIPSIFKGSDRPVENVSWEVVNVFLDRLNQRERAAGRLPAGYEYALPSEAQWEYACRAGTTGIYAGPLDALGWYDANSGGETHPVAQKQPNAWGFYDMHGNVREWCADWYGGYPGDRASDPTGPATGSFRSFRGGGVDSNAGECRSAFRMWMAPNLAGATTGFRLALVPRH